VGRQIEELARFAAGTRWDDIPDPVRRHAKLVLLDTLGVMLAGAARPETRALRERLADGGGTGATVYAPGWPAQDARTAALLNGIAGRAIELCEGTRLISAQPAIQILPGLLAIGEQRPCSGRDLLSALVCGYELAARLCKAFTPRPLAHPNGQATLLAAVAAGARLRGLDAAGVGLAMRIATTMVVTPSYTDAVAGATALNVAGGMSGFAAVLAPDLALAGFEAQPDAVELSLGQLVGGGFAAEGLLDELGTRWEITRNYFRLHACCSPIHPALDALQDALAALAPGAGEIERIEVETYRFASVMRNPEPPNYFAAKYSLPHAAATLAVRGGTGFSALDDSSLADPMIAALRHRVHVAEDEAMSALAPRLKPARVTLLLKDGRRVTCERESARGDFNQPYEASELRAKFRELAGQLLTPEGTAALEQAVDRCDEWARVDELPALLRRHGRA
jgi:2-methylcitrate dehydratase PrpD